MYHEYASHAYTCILDQPVDRSDPVVPRCLRNHAIVVSPRYSVTWDTVCSGQFMLACGDAGASGGLLSQRRCMWKTRLYLTSC